MKIRTSGDWSRHETVTVDNADVNYCADAWCDGRCGMPALVIPAEGQEPELRVRSSATAFGPTFQPWRHTTWNGAKVEVPEADRAMSRRMYWW